MLGVKCLHDPRVQCARPECRGGNGPKGNEKVSKTTKRTRGDREGRARRGDVLRAVGPEDVRTRRLKSCVCVCVRVCVL